MSSVSKIFEKGRVDIPDRVLRVLDLKEGSEIVWRSGQNGRVYIERKTPQTLLEFDRVKFQSETRSQLLLALKHEPKTFNDLQRLLKVSEHTVDNHLKDCLKEGFIEHKGRNKPYSLTQKGLELLRISERQPLEGNDVVIETVRQGQFLGSIIIRLPSHMGRQFSKNLYTPKGIEDLNRIMVLALEFWVSQHSQQQGVSYVSTERDLNGDGIPELIISEMPQGYPNIRRALKENRMPMPLWDYCLMAAEEKLSELVKPQKGKEREKRD